MNIKDNKAIKELILLCQKEKPYGTKAFESLVRTFQPAIYRFCFNYIKNEAEAEELTQNVFLKVFHSIQKFKHESSFKTWIYKISLNICTDFYNKKKKQRQIIEEINSTRSADQYISSAHTLYDSRDNISKHLEKLSEQEREIIILRYFEDLKLQEIAETLDIQLSAAKMRLSRALEHFKVIYDP